MQEGESSKQRIEQKEKINDQMVEMLNIRLSNLGKLAEDRRYGLECDVNPDTGYCTKRVPRLKPPHEEDDRKVATRRNRAFVNESTPLPMSSANIAMMERLGFDTEDSPKMGGPRKGGNSKWNNKWQEKIETKKAQKSEIERELQANLEGFVTRSVENVIYTMEKAPIQMQPKLLLSYALQRIVFPHGERMFKHFSLNALSQKLFCSIYWFIHCNFFQPESEKEQEFLLMDVASTFVKLLNNLKAHKDFFFKIYPYLLASAVTWGFHYLCPGSRHLYTPSFKRQVYMQVACLLLGMNICPVSVQVTRQFLFPDEVVEDVEPIDRDLDDQFVLPEGMARAASTIAAATTGSATTKTSSVTGQGVLSEDTGMAELPPRMQLSASAPALGQNQTTTPTAAAAAAASTTGGTTAASAAATGRECGSGPQKTSLLEAFTMEMQRRGPPSAGDEDTPPPAIRQSRTPFQASGISPLVRAYLRHPSGTAGRPGYSLQRTTPVSNCHVGGYDTFHQKPSRSKTHESIKAEHRRARAQFLQLSRKSQRQLGTTLADIEEDRFSVMRGGMSNIGRFCLDLVQRAESKRRGEEFTRAGSFTMPSHSTAGNAE